MAKPDLSRPGAGASFRHTAKVRQMTPIARALVAIAVGGSMIAGLTPAVAQPVNPDDESIAQAQAQVQAGDGEVVRLATSVSETEAEVNRVELEMGALREAVNKALVDLEVAQAEAEQARKNADAAKTDLDDSQAQIEAAQSRLDEISRAAYRQNGTSKGLSGMSGNGASEDALERQTYLRTTAEKQRAAVDELDRLRTENANKESALREARNIAEQREAEAAQKERDAQAAIDSNSAELSVLTSQRNSLVAEHDDAKRNLDIARAQAANLDGQRAEYEEFQRAEQARKQAEAQAAAAAEEKRKSEEAAAAAKRAVEAAQEAQRAQAAEEAQQAQEAEAASKRAAAEQRAAQAQEAADAAQAEAEKRAAEDAQAQTQREQALAAAAVAAAALVAASQSENAASTNPAQPAPTPEEPAVGSSTGSSDESFNESTDGIYDEDDYYDDSVYDQQPANPGSSLEGSDGASEIVTGDRAAKIEAVIARAMTQIGTPYAWGGGDANGPTLGIRDGGVADSYGDYNKVGFDCSGLTMYAFAAVGINLQHYTGYQYTAGTQLPSSQMQRGDLIFYGPGASQHVAIYLGDGQMLEAPNSGSTVRISPVRTSGMTENVVRLI